MPVDLHTHSTESDGRFSPERVVQMAATHGVTHLALTDHDTLSGIERARTEARAHGIEIISGLELSTSHRQFRYRPNWCFAHLLVYFLEGNTGPLQDRLPDVRRARGDRNRAITDRLQELGYEITMHDVAKHAPGNSVGKPHIADALIAKGYFESRRDVFRDLLGRGGPAEFNFSGIGLIEAIGLARDSGGVPVLAHPKTVTPPKSLDAFIRELREAGLGGVEVHHPMHDQHLRRSLYALTTALGIAATGGSDFHDHSHGARFVGAGNGAGLSAAMVEGLIAQRDR